MEKLLKKFEKPIAPIRVYYEEYRYELIIIKKLKNGKYLCYDTLDHEEGYNGLISFSKNELITGRQAYIDNFE